jgi:aspartate aminotransferase-like enzyme
MTPGRPNLRITGPTPLPPDVLGGLGDQMLSHRSEAFRGLLRRCLAALRPLFGATEAAILPFTASGTGGLEAAVANLVAAGDRVLAVQMGHFGERFAEIAVHYGAEVVRLEVPWGRAADPDEVRSRLRAAGPFQAVLLTHNETSTGVLNPLREIAAAVREESGALLLVDGVSSVGTTGIAMDAWGVDAVVTASQKGLMSPPGLAPVAAGPRALAAAARHRTRPYYFDFARMADAVAEGTTTYTPALGTLFALDRALQRIHAEGVPQVFARHLRLAAACRESLAALGLSGFADPAHASPAVTSALVPDGWTATELRRRLEAEHGVFVSQGRGIWKERMLRCGHMGWVEQEDIDHLAGAVRAVLHGGPRP